MCVAMSGCGSKWVYQVEGVAVSGLTWLFTTNWPTSGCVCMSQVGVAMYQRLVDG